MRRIRSAAMTAVACLAGVLLSLAPPATAQTGGAGVGGTATGGTGTGTGGAGGAALTGYPPGPCTVLSSSQFVGDITVGQTFTIRVTPTCLFTPGGTATIVVNGSQPFTKTVNPDGTVTIERSSRFSAANREERPQVDRTGSVSMNTGPVVFKGR